MIGRGLIGRRWTFAVTTCVAGLGPSAWTAGATRQMYRVDKSKEEGAVDDMEDVLLRFGSRRVTCYTIKVRSRSQE